MRTVFGEIQRGWEGPSWVLVKGARLWTQCSVTYETYCKGSDRVRFVILSVRRRPRFHRDAKRVPQLMRTARRLASVHSFTYLIRFVC